MTRATLVLSLLLLAGCESLPVPVEREPAPLSQEFTAPITTPEELASRLVRDGMTTTDGQRSLGLALEAYGACYRSREALIAAEKARAS